MNVLYMLAPLIRNYKLDEDKRGKQKPRPCERGWFLSYFLGKISKTKLGRAKAAF